MYCIVKWVLIMITDNNGILWTKAFSLCFILQVSHKGHLMLSGRKIFTLFFIKVLAMQKSCWSRLLLLIRGGTFPHSHCLNGCQGGIKWNFINNTLTGLSLTMGKGCFCVGICTRASPHYSGVSTSQPLTHWPHTRLTRGFPGAGGTWLHPRVWILFRSNFVYGEIGSFSHLFYGHGTMSEMAIKNTSGFRDCQLLCRLDL